MPVDVALHLAEGQLGLVARSQLRAAGCSRSTIEHLVAGGEWRLVTDEVLLRRGAPDVPGRRLLVAVLDTGPGSYLSHPAAGRWWGLNGCSSWPIHVVRTAPTTRHSELAVVHRVRRLPLEWVCTLGCVPVVRPELLALQLFAVCSEPRAGRLTDRLWSERLLSGPSIDRFLVDLGQRGRNGTAGLRRYLEARGPDYVPPASGLESRMMELAAEAGVPLERQVDSGGERWTGRVDFRHPHLPVIIEVQSERFHSALSDREADRRRIEALQAAGFTVIEITDVMVWSRPGEVVRRLRAATTARPVL